MAITADTPRPPPADTEVAGQRVDWTPKDVIVGLIWLLVLFIAIPLAITGPIGGIYGAESNPFYASALTVAMLSEAGIAVAAAYLTFRKYGGGWERLGIRPIDRGILLWAAGTFVAAFLFATLYGVIINVIDVPALTSKCDDQVPAEILNNNGLLALAGVSIIAFAPVCEETFFRGFVFPGLARRWGLWAGIVASAALFSLAHLTPSLHKTFVPIFGIGAIFAFSYARTGNLFSSILAHLAFNVMSFSLLSAGDCP